MTSPVLIRLAIFDFDGTLADSGRLMLGVLNQAAAKYRFRALSEADVERLRKLDNRAIMREIGVSMWRLPAIAKYMREEAAKRPPPPLFEGVPQMIDALKANGVQVAIVSSNSERIVRAALGEALAAKIDYYGCDADMFGKASKFKALIRKARVKPHEAVSVGDETRDIEAARKIGMRAAAVTWGYAHESVLADFRPEFVYRTVAELEAGLLSA
jgi:phosphoglycolate phosphatase